MILTGIVWNIQVILATISDFRIWLHQQIFKSVFFLMESHPCHPLTRLECLLFVALKWPKKGGLVVLCCSGAITMTSILWGHEFSSIIHINFSGTCRRCCLHLMKSVVVGTLIDCNQLVHCGQQLHWGPESASWSSRVVLEPAGYGAGACMPWSWSTNSYDSRSIN